MVFRQREVDVLEAKNLATCYNRHRHSEAVQLAACEVAVDALQVGSVLVLRLGQRVPDDVADPLDQRPAGPLPPLLLEEAQVAVASDDRLKLGVERLHDVQLHWRLDPQVLHIGHLVPRQNYEELGIDNFSNSPQAPQNR